jgi:WD40 repeat protein
MKKSRLLGAVCIYLSFVHCANAALVYTTSDSFNDIEAFDPDSGQRLIHITGNCANEMAFGSDGNLYCGSGDINVIDLTTGATIRQIPTLNETTTIAFAPDGSLYATSNSFNDIEVFNPHTGVRLNLFSGNCANEMAFGPDGNLYCGVGDVDVLNPTTGAAIRQISTLNETTAIAFSSSGDLYATSTTFNDIEVFNPLTGIRLSHFSGNCSHDMAFGPDGNLYCATGDIEVLNPTTGATIRSIVSLNTSNTLAFAVPIPPSLWPFGSGLLGLIGVARKKTG